MPKKSQTSNPYQFFSPMTESEFANLKESISQFGQLNPIIVDENDTILNGHHRWRACFERERPVNPTWRI